jgi:hypothetical protein
MITEIKELEERLTRLEKLVESQSAIKKKWSIFSDNEDNLQNARTELMALGINTPNINIVQGAIPKYYRLIIQDDNNVFDQDNVINQWENKHNVVFKRILQ